MMFMNEHEIEDLEYRTRNWEHQAPNLVHAIQVLNELKNWTNRNSDGWPYWAKPVRAAKQLMVLIQSDNPYYRSIDTVGDIDEKDLRKALVPIKAFRTRQGIEFHTGLEQLLAKGN
jgi:hypothetical protein